MSYYRPTYRDVGVAAQYLTAHFLPTSDNQFDLGSSAQRFRSLYVAGAITLGSAVVSSITVSGTTTLATSLNGVVKATAGVISAAALLNVDVSASAAIDFSKLATLTSGNILVGSVANVATSVAMSGDITISNAGVTAIGAGKVTNAMLAGSIAYSKLVLTGSILNADVSASAAIAYGKLALTGAILNADLAGSIAYSKLSLTGAILNADLAGSIAYSKLSLTGAILNADLAGSIAYSKLSLTGAILNADLAGSIAYSKLSLTGAILNADLAGSIAYSKLTLTTSIVNNDIAVAAAIAGTKVAPNFGSQVIQTTGNLTINTDAFAVDASGKAVTLGAAGGTVTHVINGNQLNFVGGTSNTQAQLLFNNSNAGNTTNTIIAIIGPASQTGNNMFSFRRSSDSATAWSVGQNNASSNRFEIAQGSSALGTNSFLTILTDGTMGLSTSGKLTTVGGTLTVTGAATMSSTLNVTGATTLATSLTGTLTAISGVVTAVTLFTNWASYTPTITGFGTVSANVAYWRRVGDTLEVQGTFVTGTPSGSAATISTGGLTIETTKLTATKTALVGHFVRATGSDGFIPNVSNGPFLITVDNSSTSTVAITINANSTGSIVMKSAIGTDVGSGSMAYRFSVPIVSWAL